MRGLWRLDYRNRGLLHHSDVCLVLGSSCTRLGQRNCLPGHSRKRSWLRSYAERNTDWVCHRPDEPPWHSRAASPGPVPNRRVTDHRGHACHSCRGCRPHRWYSNPLLQPRMGSRWRWLELRRFDRLEHGESCRRVDHHRPQCRSDLSVPLPGPQYVRLGLLF